jgi:hypothetical protein
MACALFRQLTQGLSFPDSERQKLRRKGWGRGICLLSSISLSGVTCSSRANIPAD